MPNTTESATMCEYQIVLENAGLAAADASSDRDARCDYRASYMARHAADLTACGKCERCAPSPVEYAWLRDLPTVWVQGYEFFVEYAWLRADGAIYFVGACTSNPCNDSIRHTGYNGGDYRFPQPANIVAVGPDGNEL